MTLVKSSQCLVADNLFQGVCRWPAACRNCRNLLVPSGKLPENDRMLEHEIIQKLRVPPDRKIRLKDYDSGWQQTKELQMLGKDAVKERAKDYLEKTIAEPAEAQELLYADNTYSILMILQAMDAAGKDGTIKHVMSGVNPQGCHVVS